MAPLTLNVIFCFVLVAGILIYEESYSYNNKLLGTGTVGGYCNVTSRLDSPLRALLQEEFAMLVGWVWRSCTLLSMQDLRD